MASILSHNDCPWPSVSRALFPLRRFPSPFPVVICQHPLLLSVDVNYSLTFRCYVAFEWVLFVGVPWRKCILNLVVISFEDVVLAFPTGRSGFITEAITPDGTYRWICVCEGNCAPENGLDDNVTINDSEIGLKFRGWGIEGEVGFKFVGSRTKKKNQFSH